MNEEIDKRFRQALDLVQWIDARVAKQVEYHVKKQLEQRLSQEREYWRCHMVDMLAKERELTINMIDKELEKERARIFAGLERLLGKNIDWVNQGRSEILDIIEQNNERLQKLIAKVQDSVERVFDRLEARLQEVVPGMRHRSDDDDQPPPLKH